MNTRYSKLAVIVLLVPLCFGSQKLLQVYRVERVRASTPSPAHTPTSLPISPPDTCAATKSAPSKAVPGVVMRGSSGARTIALTFDACAMRSPSHCDDRIIKVLVDTKTPATFFLSGKWMIELPDRARYLASIPFFELGNHTFLHPHMTTISKQQMFEELQKTQDVLDSLTGQRARFFRPPYGEYDSLIVTVARQVGLVTVEYSLASGDPDTNATKERLIEYVSTMARNGSIIVMHVNGRGWHTAEALPEIISRLRNRGFSFVTLGELIGVKVKY